jgi:catechol 2,3-dioxygenase-like lactoylglutathione lyase family enzyme
LAFYEALGYAVEERVSMGKVLGTPASTSDVTFLRKVSPGGIDMRIDHIQLAMPEGGEVEARRFFGGLLGLEETPKPESLRSTGGCWFRGDGCELHLGVDPDFRPQRKAHPGFAVAHLRILARTLEAAGYSVVWDDRIADVDRFYTNDPFGNRLEFRGESPG